MPSYKSATYHCGRRKPSAHDPNALPPAVAVLLAVTAIPPRRRNRYRGKSGPERRISIEELVRDWKTDHSLKSSYGSSPALNVLLEDTDEYLFEDAPRKDSGLSQPCYLNARSASSESMPSLESDDRSILSVGSPSTPESLRSRRSYQNLKRDKARSLPASEDCALDHPLVPRAESDDADDFLLPVQKQTPATKSRSSFKSNLTTSLQNLKNAAVNSISSLGRVNSAQAMTRFPSPPIDDALWSHPFLFPRLSSEMRPSVLGTPSLAERRYLNPQPLVFEEQEAPFQQALHAPFLAEIVEDAPIIQMQTYNRGRKRGGSARRGGPNPNSEAGRALLGGDGVRQREVRENSNFLRVVVLEMNMRRAGKLEQGRAKIWLAPREVSVAPAARRGRRVPKRWEGVSAC
ncbi:Hypothetical predicted protein [Lecanosticta acicola]|uniref:Uncharacterized protein n=1 Tax=Lecanosticta acicola TaxID=111012 RepID=A0AAI8YS93_9PEZI|nr:Hypothetical predicted protein [Lecanosticta acicola]